MDVIHGPIFPVGLTYFAVHCVLPYSIKTSGFCYLLVGLGHSEKHKPTVCSFYLAWRASKAWEELDVWDRSSDCQLNPDFHTINVPAPLIITSGPELLGTI